MKLAIYGYGNLGHGVEAAVRTNPDMELMGIFTRRDPKTVRPQTGVPVYAAEEIGRFKNEIDAADCCMARATSFWVQPS